MTGELIIHMEAPYYCEVDGYTFGPDYTAHWCPHPEATGEPDPLPPRDPADRWVKLGDHT